MPSMKVSFKIRVTVQMFQTLFSFLLMVDQLMMFLLELHFYNKKVSSLLSVLARKSKNQNLTLLPETRNVFWLVLSIRIHFRTLTATWGLLRVKNRLNTWQDNVYMVADFRSLGLGSLSDKQEGEKVSEEEQLRRNQECIKKELAEENGEVYVPTESNAEAPEIQAQIAIIDALEAKYEAIGS